MSWKKKFLGLAALLVALTAIAGCGGGGGTYILFLDYPEGADLNSVTSVEVFALKASTDATCGALIDGTAPSEFGNPKVTYFSEANPADESLKGIGSGEWVFYARVKNPDVFLHGCTTAKAGEDITISLDFI